MRGVLVVVGVALVGFAVLTLAGVDVVGEILGAVSEFLVGERFTNW